MKKFIAAIIITVGLLSLASYLFPQDDLEASDDDAYGDPDGQTSESDVASFVD